MVYRDFQDFLLVAEFGDSPVENQEYIDALLSVSVRRIVHDAADFLVWDGTGAFMLHAKGIVPVFDFPEEGAEKPVQEIQEYDRRHKNGADVDFADSTDFAGIVCGCGRYYRRIIRLLGEEKISF